MRRTGLALWGAWGLLLLAACGDGGSATGLAPAGFGYGVDDDTNGSATEPSGSRTEQPSSATETASCGADSIITLSEAIRLVTLPLCEFEESCTEREVQPPDDDEPTPNEDGTQTRALQTGLQDVPEFCVELAISRSPGLTQEDECGLFQALAEVAEDVPGCQQHVVLPAGTCTSTFAHCIDDLVAAGCAAYHAGQLPRSCAYVSDLD
jgi:hypothetical protein